MYGHAGADPQRGGDGGVAAMAHALAHGDEEVRPGGNEHQEVDGSECKELGKVVGVHGVPVQASNQRGSMPCLPVSP